MPVLLNLQIATSGAGGEEEEGPDDGVDSEEVGAGKRYLQPLLSLWIICPLEADSLFKLVCRKQSTRPS